MGLSPPFLELGPGVPASGTERAAPLHDRRPQAKAKDSLKHELMRAKVVQVRQRGYIKPGNVTSGTHYFCVDKGTSDIRMVYNGTSCGLNACLHAPHYGLL